MSASPFNSLPDFVETSETVCVLRNREIKFARSSRPLDEEFEILSPLKVAMTTQLRASNDTRLEARPTSSRISFSRTFSSRHSIAFDTTRRASPLVEVYRTYRRMRMQERTYRVCLFVGGVAGGRRTGGGGRGPIGGTQFAVQLKIPRV